jgi:hypothetical protein
MNAGLSYLTAALSLSSAAAMLRWWRVAQQPEGRTLPSAALCTAHSFALTAVTAAFVIIFTHQPDWLQRAVVPAARIITATAFSGVGSFRTVHRPITRAC